MNWLQQHPAQFALAIVTLGLGVSTVSLLHQRHALQTLHPLPPAVVPALATFEPVASLSSAVAAVPAVWDATARGGSLFVSREYIKSGTRLESPDDAMFHPPVPNRWLKAHGLDYHDPNILQADSDRDGFKVLDEWLGADKRSHLDANQKPALGMDGKALPDDSTDPADAKSHPPYDTQLALDRITSAPLQLTFTARPDQNWVVVNTSLRGVRSFYGNIGGDVPGTPYKIASLEEKSEPGRDGTKRDISELTLVHQTSGRKLVLPLGKTMDVPERRAVLSYHWALPGQPPTPPMTKGCNESFTLPPESDHPYRVTDIADSVVTIQRPDGSSFTLQKTP